MGRCVVRVTHCYCLLEKNWEIEIMGRVCSQGDPLLLFPGGEL